MGSRSLRVACAALLGVRLAGATSPAAPQVAFTDCEREPLGKQAFLRALALELGRGQLHEGSLESAAIVVSYGCDGVARVQVRGTQGKLVRELRTDDVSQKDRARALALSVAELARASDGNPDHAEASAATDAAAGASAREESPAPSGQSKTEAPASSPSRAPQSSEVAGSPLTRAKAPGGSRWAVQLSGALRLNLDVEALYYGGALGLELSRFRLQLEGFSRHTTTSRGGVASGLLALRVGRALPLVRLGVVEVGLIASAALGANWALGSSSVPGTLVRQALMPYADARIGLGATSSARTPFTPLCELYAGRAAGIVATVDGADVLATGGWFSGVDLGLWL